MARHPTPRIHEKNGKGLLTAVVAAIVAITLFQTAKLEAQESQPAHEATAKQETPGNAQGKEGVEKKEAKETKEAVKEAEESGGTDALRNSPLVLWIARHTGLSKNVAYWLCVVLNFSIVFFSIALFLRKRLPVKFRNRTASIQQRLEEARKTSEDARRRLDEVEGRLARLDVEITEMRREADENAQAEEKRVLAGVTEERRRIVQSAELEIAMAANAARRDLKTYVAELAVALAEKRIKVAKDTDQSLVRDFTANLGKDGNY
jgi:F-type H+-transporting ATPase subunit b